MEKFSIKDENGLELTVEINEDSECEVISGGLSSNPNWDEYLSMYKEEYRPHFILIKRAIEKLGWIGDTAECRANDALFSFSGGLRIGFTWRAWGDLMSAIVGKREGYMKYYM